MTDPTLDYFLKLGQIQAEDAALIQWSHATNSKHKVAAALKGIYMTSGLQPLLYIGHRSFDILIIITFC